LSGAARQRHNAQSSPKPAGQLRLTDDTESRVSPFVVGVTGHRDLKPDSLPPVREALTAILRELKERLPESTMRIKTGMAAGADLLAVQTALDLGFGVDAVLPMPLADYSADFDADSLALLNRLLAHPRVSCVELPFTAQEAEAAAAAGVSTRDARYSILTQTLTRSCSLLIALWDGESSILPGGTGDTVLRYLGVRSDRNKDDVRLQFLDAAKDPELPVRLVYWIPAVRAGSAPGPDSTEPCFLAGLSDNTLLRLPPIPRQLDVHLWSLNEYNSEYLDYVSGWRQRPNPDSLISGLPGTVTVNERDRSTLERIDAQYGKADALALYFQRRSDQLFAFFNLVAFVMGVAYLTYEKFFRTRALLFAYLLVLMASAGLYYVLHERRWFAKHLMCRALAETLRVKFYLRLASGEDLVDAEEVLALSHVNRFHGFGWIGHVLIALASPPVGTEPNRAPDQEDGVGRWIEEQRRYFVRKVAQLHRSAIRTKWLKRILFAVIIVVVLTMLALGEAAGYRLLGEISAEKVLAFVIGFIAVTLAAWELHQNKMAARELLWQYRNQLKHFARAHLQLTRTVGSSRRREILAELGKDSLMESYLWTIHRFHREHEPPGPA
jgi:hypothetical protein